MATTRKLILDTDTGLDDAQAILMALSVIDVEIVGITCVAGNADVIQVGRNVLRVLQVAERLQVGIFLVPCRILIFLVRVSFVCFSPISTMFQYTHADLFI